MSTTALSPLPVLPKDAQSILNLAAKSLFDVFAHASEGMLLVDRSGCVVWINDQYRRYLPALGFANEQAFVGQPVSEVVQNTQMQKVLETGKPILIDLLTNKAGTDLTTQAGASLTNKGLTVANQASTKLENKGAIIESKASAMHTVQAGALMIVKGAISKLN